MVLHGSLGNNQNPVLQLPFNSPLTMDPKGRVTLPTRLVGRLEARSLVWVPFQNHLRGYSGKDWAERVEAPLMVEDAWDPAVAEKHRRRLALASELEVDPHGRFVVPPYLRQRAGLTRDCILVSYKEFLELWDAERWQAWVDLE